MANISGIGTTFAPGSEEYKRVTFDLDDDEYYVKSRFKSLILNQLGNIPGAVKTDTQMTKPLTIESRKVDQLKFEILTHDANLVMQTTLVTGALTTGTKGTVNTYSVDDASILRPYDVIQNMNTGEFLWIATVDTSTSPDEITAYPGFKQTGFTGKTAFPWTLSDAAATTKTNGDVIRIVGTAFPEGSSSSNFLDSRPTAAINYIQHFREDYSVTWEEEQQAKHGKMAIADKEKRALGNLLVKAERALIEGVINEESVTDPNTSSTKTILTMQGIKGFPSTYNQAATALVGGGADITKAKLDQLCDQVAPGIRGEYAIGLCSGTFTRKLRELMENSVNIDVNVGAKEFGLKASRYHGPDMTIDFVRHDIFDATGNSDELLIYDPKNFKLVNYADGTFGKVSDKKGLPSNGLSTNNTLTMQDAWVGWYSLEYRNEAGSALVTGLSHTISS